MRYVSWRSLLCSLLLSLFVFLPACDVVGPAIVPVITRLLTEIIDGQQKLDVLDSAAKEWFKEYPNAALEFEWQKAVDTTQAALDVALTAAHGAKEMAVGDHNAAIVHFVSAWNQLATLARQIGILSTGDTFAAGGCKGLKLDPPLALRAGAAP